MINKKVNSVHEAHTGISSGMTLMLGGFGLCGIPENAIKQIQEATAGKLNIPIEVPEMIL